MMSQIIMSTCTRRATSGIETGTSFFDTRVPIVVMYCSSNMFMTYRRTREVLPTAFSPRTHTCDLRRFVANRCPRSAATPHSGGGYLTLLASGSPSTSARDGEALAFEDHRSEPLEQELHVLSRLRGGVKKRCFEGP